MPQRTRRAFGSLFTLAGLALLARYLLAPSVVDSTLALVGGGALLAGMWFWQQTVDSTRHAFGTVFTVLGVALVVAHLADPAMAGHDMIALGVGSVLMGAWLWVDVPSVLHREDLLGIVFFATGVAMLYHNWWAFRLENKTTLLAVGLMVLGAHYISLEKSTAVLKSMANYLFPWFRSKGGDPPP